MTFLEKLRSRDAPPVYFAFAFAVSAAAFVLANGWLLFHPQPARLLATAGLSAAIAAALITPAFCAKRRAESRSPATLQTAIFVLLTLAILLGSVAALAPHKFWSFLDPLSVGIDGGVILAGVVGGLYLLRTRNGRMT